MLAESTDASDRASATSVQFPLLLLCFFLSGLAALIYQTAWTRSFAFVFGTSELAVATVLAAYMGGLAAGAAIAARFATRVTRPILTYGLLELGIALSALAVPAGIQLSRALHVAVFRTSGAPPGDGGPAVAIFYLVCSFAILLVPTALMGATLPLLVRYAVRSESQIGPRIGLLYTINTIGAVAGTLVAGFALLPALGLTRTMFVAVGANAAVFAVAALLARGATPLGSEGRPARSVRKHGAQRWILVAILASGVVSFTYEVLWTRLLGHVLGASVYAFATMLATFLTGIALGAAVAARLSTSARRATLGFGWAQIGTALLSLAAFQFLEAMPTLTKWIDSIASAGPVADVLISAIVLLPSTLCIGATFPFAVRIYALDEHDASSSSATVYGWNTLGAIIGAVGAGFFLIPALGYAAVLALAATANLGLAALSAWRLAGRARGFLIATSALAIVALAVLRPGPPWGMLRMSALGHRSLVGEVEYLGVGRSATVLLRRDAGVWWLTTNGLPESSIEPVGGRPASTLLVKWLASIGSLARPDATSQLVIGLGGGVLLESLPGTLRSIDVIEIEPEVVRANEVVAGVRAVDPLSDPRIHLIVNDARGALSLTTRRYDVIASQPSHPWTAGASHLYTKEFFELVREHLVDEGVFVQWMGLRFIDEELLRSLVATLLTSFDNVRLYSPNMGGVLFVASQGPLDIERTAAEAIAANVDDFAQMEIFGPEDPLAAMLMDEEGARSFAAGGIINTDDYNVLQARSPVVMRERKARFDSEEILGPYDPLVPPPPGWDPVYLVRRAIQSGNALRARRIARSVDDPALRPTLIGISSIGLGKHREGALQLARALELDSGAEEARFALLAHRMRVLAALNRLGRSVPDDFIPEIHTLAEPLPESARSVIDAWLAEERGDWETLQSLELGLAGVSPLHPAFLDATRLRVRWRVERNDRELAREALRILDQSGRANVPADELVMRARASITAGYGAAAVSSLGEVARILSRSVMGPRKGPAAPRQRQAQAALDVLGTVPKGDVPATSRMRLAARLHRVLGGTTRRQAPKSM